MRIKWEYGFGVVTVSGLAVLAERWPRGPYLEAGTNYPAGRSPALVFIALNNQVSFLYSRRGVPVQSPSRA